MHIGDSIVVFGAGPVGLLCCAVAKAYGASKIIAVDIVQSRLDLAVSYAATHQHKAERGDTPATNAQKIIQKILLKEGADRAIDASGAPSSIASAIHVLRPGGSYVQAGMGQSEITFPITMLCIKELKMSGSFRYGPGLFPRFMTYRR